MAELDAPNSKKPSQGGRAVDQYRGNRNLPAEPFNPLPPAGVKQRNLGPASMIFGAAAGVIGVIGVVYLFTGTPFTGAMLVLTAGVLGGFAWQYME